MLTGSEYPERRANCESGACTLASYYPEIRPLRDASLDRLDAHAKSIPEVVPNRGRFIIFEEITPRIDKNH